MKFGQALSIFEAALPEEMAGPYRAMLTKLQDSAPPMPTQLGPSSAARGPRDRSGAATSAPSTTSRPPSASIGQVHRAVWTDGRDGGRQDPVPRGGRCPDERPSAAVAGWPGWPLAGFPGIDLGPILDELRDRMAEELDYRLEADNQAAFAEAFADDPDFAIPKRGPRHRARHRLGVGRRAPASARSSARARRRSATRRRSSTCEFLLAGPAEAGLLHADPHPGNFRITPDGRLGVARLRGGQPPPQRDAAGARATAHRRPRGRRRRRSSPACERPASSSRPSTSTLSGCSQYLEPFLAPAAHRRVHLHAGLAAERVRPHQRPAAAELRRSPTSSTCRRSTC